MDLSKVIHLFESKHTQNLSDRHAAGIVQLCKEMINEDHTRGFYYKDLPQVAKVFDLAFTGIQNGKYKLIPAVLQLLEVVRVPFEKEKSSDENKQVPNLPILFNSLCPYFRYDMVSKAGEDVEAKTLLEYDQICTEIANTISTIASFGIQDIKDQEASLEDKMMFGSETSPMQRLYQKGNRNLRGLAQSEIPETLVNVLASNQKSKDTIVAVIEAISNASLYLPNAEKFSQMGVLKDLVRIISEAPDFRSYIVHISIEAIWNLIEVEGQKAIETMASQQEVVLALRQPFERVLKEGYKLDDKCLRNEICILINYVVTCIASHQFFLERETPQDSTFLEAILYYATHDELAGKDISSGEGSVGKGPIKPLFTTRDEDVEFKKLLWTGILYLVRDPDNVEAHQCVIDKNFMSALLMYIDPNNSNVSSHRWQPPQLKEIQVHGLSVISNILPLIPEHFHSINGHVILIQFLSAYNDYERRIACMKALLNTSTYDYFKKDFADKGIVDILLDIVQNSKENPLDMREMAFNIISNISKDCRPNQKEFRRKGGIEILKENLAYSEVDQTGNASTFLLSVLDCLNNAVFGNKRCELHFLDIEGVYVLLDLIESCEPALKRLTLSSLCTILENNKSFQYFVEWNSSKTTINATQLLINLYESEDQRYGVTYANGILENTERPLHPKASYMINKYGNESGKDALNVSQSKHSQANDSVVFRDNGMNVSARHASRISEGSQKTQRSIITNNPEKPINLSTSKAAKGLKQALEAAGKLGTKHLSESYLNKIMMDVAKSYDIRATIFGTFYRVGFDLHELSSQEKQRMEIIQLYPYLKNGEIWRDIKEELADQNIRPTSDDKHWMETCIEESQEQTEGAVHNQSLYAQDIKMKDQEELDNYFAAIRLKNQINAKGMTTSKK